MAEKNLEVKVGIFVLIGLAILVAFILLIGDFKDWNNRYNINIFFGFIDGVKVGSPVRFAGLDAGEVKDVVVVNPTLTNNKMQLQITARLKGHIKIPRDSQVWVNTLGLLGEKYIEIMPGVDYANVLKNDDVVSGNDPVAMHSVMVSTYGILGELKKTIQKLNDAQGTVPKLFFEDDIYKSLQDLVEDLKKHPWKLFYRTKEKTVKEDNKTKSAPKTNIITK